MRKIKTKKELREELLESRSLMKSKEVEEKSEKIIETFLKIEPFEKYETIMVYLDFDNEVSSRRILRESLRAGKRVVVPYCKKEKIEIIPLEIEDENVDFKVLKNGFKQPNIKKYRPIDVEKIDVIVLTGIAFDKRCFRIGFGIGYYDIFLKKISENIDIVGLAYDYQIVDKINEEGHDIQIDYVVTEKRVILASERRAVSSF